jgi:hypothetical protein
LGNEGEVSFTTFQKELNLHLYIPAALVHHPATPKGTIFGNIQKYYNLTQIENDIEYDAAIVAEEKNK